MAHTRIVPSRPKALSMTRVNHQNEEDSPITRQKPTSDALELNDL